MRNAFPREFYIGKNDQVIAQQDDLIVYGQEMAGKWHAKAFGGKRAKYDWYYAFKTTEARDKHIADWMQGRQATKAYRATEKAKRDAAPRGLEVGDILYSSWGYDQTNIDYYQVTALIGDCMVEIREIGSQSEETAYMQGKCVPAPNQFVGKPMRKIAKNGYVRLTSYCGASKMQPVAVVAGAKVYESKHWTAYA
jgi:hypothetical protein